jgi:hypothetical protein
MWILGYLCILASFDWSTFDNEVELNACLAVFEIVKGIGKWHLKQNVPKLLFNWCNNSICPFLSSFFISSKIQMKMLFFYKKKIFILFKVKLHLPFPPLSWPPYEFCRACSGKYCSRLLIESRGPPPERS